MIAIMGEVLFHTSKFTHMVTFRYSELLFAARENGIPIVHLELVFFYIKVCFRASAAKQYLLHKVSSVNANLLSFHTFFFLVT